jgi:hypothetical protein
VTAGPKAISNTDFGGLKGVNLLDGTAATDAGTKGQIDAAYTSAISRANHTGTQLASTISDLAATVMAYRLDQFAQPTGPVAFNNQRATTLADPTAAQDAATKNYVDGQIAGVAQGLTLKGTVRVATNVNVNIAAPGTAVDGVTPANGELVLLYGQTTASQNGPWVFNGSAAALTRPANWDTSAEAVLGSYWIVREGSQADAFAIMSNDTAVTLGTTSLSFVIRGAASASTGYTTTSPATAAGGSWVVTHNLGTKWVVAQVARVGSPYDIVNARIERTTTNTVTVLPDIAIASGEYEIMISKVA